MHQPLTTSRAPLPVVRAAVFAVVGTVLGVSAHHLIADGPAPWAPSATAAAALFGLGLLGTRRRRSLVTVVASSVLAQTGLHLWLTLTAHSHRAAAMTVNHHGEQTGDAHTAWHERLHDSAAMTAAHALVAVLVAILLQRADAACWSLTRGLAAALDATRARLAAAWALLTRRPTAARGPGLPALVPEGAEQPPPLAPVLADVVVRRGPPPTGLDLVS
ncbi:hypothetical protein G5C60_03010 [Streptomyces sp. HC44]|uniref:Uncharacterized protein n=1 Tax=Streptomyces scabichelini TaxID=2711217 RepID=A0A6G4UY32_9ACTN|nr:hypothetical protein [Streptomyces scabichelini]NGO06661.1 hypothetical protein [Streptomyces scabichelini]